MLDHPHLWKLASRIPRAFDPATLHRWGLMAAHRCEHGLADRLLEGAALGYRHRLSVERLARLRVHQCMTRVLASESPDRDAEQCLEIERMLTRLERIESPEPPFELVDARSLLANWRRSPVAEDPGSVALDTVRRAA